MLMKYITTRLVAIDQWYLLLIFFGAEARNTNLKRQQVSPRALKNSLAGAAGLYCQNLITT